MTTSSFRHSSHRIYRILRALFRVQPLTSRGLVAFLFSILMLTQLAIPENDLLASVIGGGLILLLICGLFGTTLAALTLRRSLKVAHFVDEPNLSSHTSIRSGLRIEGARLPPFFQLSLERLFEHSRGRSRVTSARHIIAGRSAGEATIVTDRIIFPHRGIWRLHGIHCSISDGFGLTRMSWDLRSESRLEVSAPFIPIKMIPVVASSSRSGDQINYSRERVGDPFDLKAYDPSDGMKRILWKTFAKTGELVVRRPEPAVVPEGEIPIFVIADRYQDEVIGAFRSYVRLLEEQNIIPLVAVDGALDLTPLSDVAKIVQRTNESVWHSKTGTGESFPLFLGELQRMNPFLTHVVIFASSSAFGRALRLAQSSNIRVSLAVVPESFRSYFGASNTVRLKSNPIYVGQHSNVELHICELSEFSDYVSSAHNGSTDYGSTAKTAHDSTRLETVR